MKTLTDPAFLTDTALAREWCQLAPVHRRNTPNQQARYEELEQERLERRKERRKARQQRRAG